jgi:hypothetical protein
MGRLLGTPQAGVDLPPAQKRAKFHQGLGSLWLPAVTGHYTRGTGDSARQVRVTAGRPDLGPDDSRCRPPPEKEPGDAFRSEAAVDPVPTPQLGSDTPRLQPTPDRAALSRFLADFKTTLPMPGDPPSDTDAATDDGDLTQHHYDTVEEEIVGIASGTDSEIPN